MKKPPKKMAKLVFFVLSFIIGVGLSVQLKVNAPRQSISETAAHLQVELTDIREQKDKAQREIAELEEKIRLIKDSQLQNDEIYQSLVDELNRYELQAGMTKAVGPGIIVDFQLENPDRFETLMANFDLLLSVINKLNAAGAEGICINEERIVFSTDLRYEQGNLLVNNNPVGRTIQIRAIGDVNTLEAALNMRYGILWEMKNNFGINAKVEKSERVELPRYTQEIQFKFATIQE